MYEVHMGYVLWIAPIYHLFVSLQQSQHLSNLSRADHSFISQIESRSCQGAPSQPPSSLPMLAPQPHSYTSDQPSQLHVTTGDGTPFSQHQHGGTLTHNMLQQNLVNSSGYSHPAPVFEEERILQYSSSSVSHSQEGKYKLQSNHHHSPSCSRDHPVAKVEEIHISKFAIPTNYVHLTTQTFAGDPKLSRQTSNTSSGYGTSSSTERHSVVSMLSRDQSLGEIHLENSLQVTSTPPRKISAPPPNCGHETKKMLSQQSHSLMNPSQDIHDPYDSQENEHHEGEECRGHPSLQRQDTGHETKVEFVRSGDSVNIKQYQSAMETKRKVPKQFTVEEGIYEYCFDHMSYPTSVHIIIVITVFMLIKHKLELSSLEHNNVPHMRLASTAICREI